MIVAVLAVVWVAVAIGAARAELLIARIVETPPGHRRTPARAAVACGAGVVLCAVLAALCHLFGLAGRPDPGYLYTGMITACYVAIFVIGGPAALLLAARLTRRSWPFALGMIVPVGVALAMEVTSDPTSHNLLPFEVVFVWGPAFGLSWGPGSPRWSFGDAAADWARKVAESSRTRLSPVLCSRVIKGCD